MPSNENTGNQVRPFSDFIREQARGKTHDELSVGLQQLVQKVTETGKKGSLTYVLTVEPTKGLSALTTTDEIKVKLPEHDRPGSLFFADKAGNLTRNDPSQGDLFESLRDVSDPGQAPGRATRDTDAR